MTSGQRVALAASAIFVAALGLRPAAQQPMFRAGTNLVLLDVSVFDKKGQPVRGLAQQDFVVSEDGTPQAIGAFKSVDLPDPIAPPPTAAADWTRTVPRDVSTNNVDVHRLFVIVMDDATIVQDGAVIDRARAAAAAVVDRLGPNDLATVLFTRRDNLNVQDFTSDHARLLEAVDSFAGGYSADGGGPSCGEQIDAVRALERISGVLTAVADQRKALVFVSSSFEMGPGRGGGCASEISARLHEAFRSAQQANVNIYPIDACGVRTLVKNTPDPMNPCADTFAQPTEHAEVLRWIAANTGAEAIAFTNDFSPGIAHMFTRNSSYYLLGYSPANGAADGRLRRIDVNIPGHPDLEVWARKNYRAPGPGAGTLPDKDALGRAVLPTTGLALEMATTPLQRDAKSAAVSVLLTLNRNGAAAPSDDTLDVVVTAYRPDGRLVTTTRQSYRAPTSAPGNRARTDVVSELVLPPGRFHLRASVHSHALDADGTVYGDIDLPDYRSAPVSLSGVALSDATDRRRAATDALAGLDPYPPTTVRAFDHAGHVSAFFRVYEGGGGPLAPMDLHTTILDARDTPRLDRHDPLDALAFDLGRRSIDRRVDLPLADLPPGEYVLTVEAVQGKRSAASDVRFSVK